MKNKAKSTQNTAFNRLYKQLVYANKTEVIKKRLIFNELKRIAKSKEEKALVLKIRLSKLPANKEKRFELLFDAYLLATGNDKKKICKLICADPLIPAKQRASVISLHMHIEPKLTNTKFGFIMEKIRSGCKDKNLLDAAFKSIHNWGEFQQWLDHKDPQLVVIKKSESLHT